MSDFDCDPLFSRLYLEMLEQMTAYSARRLGDIGLAEDVARTHSRNVGRTGSRDSG